MEQFLATTAQWNELPLVLSIQETAKLLGVSRDVAYELIKAQSFPKFRIGRTDKIYTQALKGWIEKQIVQ